jgi:group I intron endonuclease
MDITQKSGIYLLRNIVNDKIYIGSSLNVYLRINAHFARLRRNVHENKRLQYSFNFHDGQFESYIVERCSEEILIEREQYYIDLYNPYYNISKTAGRYTDYSHSEEDKQKMSRIKKELYANGFQVWNKGVSPTQEVKDKISNSLKGKYTGEKHGFFGKTHTEENKKLMVAASHRRKGTINKSKKGRIIQLNKDTLEIIAKFNSTGEAAKSIDYTKIDLIRRKIAESIKYNENPKYEKARNAYGFRWIFEKDLDQLKLDELLEISQEEWETISSQATGTLVEGSETT